MGLVEMGHDANNNNEILRNIVKYFPSGRNTMTNNYCEITLR